MESNIDYSNIFLTTNSKEKFWLEKIPQKHHKNLIITKRYNYYIFGIKYLEELCSNERPEILLLFSKEIRNKGWSFIRQIENDKIKIFILRHIKAYKQSKSLYLIKDINIIPVSYLCSYILHNIKEYNLNIKNYLSEKTREYLDDNIVRLIDKPKKLLDASERLMILKVLVNATYFQTKYYISISEFDYSQKLIFCNKNLSSLKGCYKEKIEKFLIEEI